MENLTLGQIRFFNDCNTLYFKSLVLRLSLNMGLDSAFYMAIGMRQSQTENFSFDNLNDDDQDDFISALIVEMPELEF